MQTRRCDANPVGRSTLRAALGFAVVATFVAGGAAPATWDVAAPPGPATTVTVDTDEVTWANVDVSPDGKTIVFDVLGDLFVVPISGGDARALTSGLPFDSQARFSPDGAHIAFISDRSGTDNLWVMDKDGAHPRQLTAERLRKPSAPAWSPDARNIVVRKHFTAARSIGAGEIWTIPLAGGEGVPLVERQSTQKDLNEPVYSHDGRAVFFSRESWPGDDFQFNKNVHEGIYQVQRVDLDSRTVSPVIAGHGGAVRPTPSPDGRWLAYVRRHGTSADGLSSALVARELASGTERVVYDKLDQDAQEVWANYGLYPAYDWLPDSAALIAWAGGKLNRISLSGQREVIPLRVRQGYRVVRAPRVEVPVAPAEFPVKALRWVTVSPRANRVAYQALGFIYVKDLPSGTPRRLTRQQEDFELYPAFSADGNWIVYTTWNDQTYGSIRRTHLVTGKTVTLTRRPGRYLELAPSADGRSVLFRRGTPGKLLSPDWAIDAGLYTVPWTGGEPKLLRNDGKHAHHCGDGRLFATRFEPHADKPPGGHWLNDDRILIGLDSQGAEQQAYMRSEFATELRVSPDCRWLARIERGEVLVTRLGAEADATVHHASGDGGEFLSWSADGTLHWALGPELFSWRFGPDGPQGQVSRTAIGFPAAQSTPEGAVALTGARLITMRGAEVIEDGVVVINANRIAAVGKRGEVAIPLGARLLDLTGSTLMPGLIDSHWHGEQMEEGIHPRQNWMHAAALALGVTTVFDPAPVSYEIFPVAELARAGLIRAPRIFGTGSILFGATRDYTAVIESYADALKQLRRRKAVGASAVKSYLQPRREQQQQIVAAARELGMAVMAELSMANMNALAQVMDGNTSVEHNLPFVNVYSDVVQLWSQTDVDSTPTLLVAMSGLFAENYFYQQSEVHRHPLLSRHVPPPLLLAESMRRVASQPQDYNAFRISQSVARMHEAGVRVLTGGHGQREGLGLHWEMWLLAAGGMKTLDVLRAATLSGAEHLGMAADLGSIEPGKLADLVVLNADPIADIRNTDRIRYVVANGVVLEAATLDAVHGAPRKPYFWESGAPR
jgi:imidazolonepropionase-like amidohydrolase/Tol biopolymer transport system component